MSVRRRSLGWTIALVAVLVAPRCVVGVAADDTRLSAKQEIAFEASGLAGPDESADESDRRGMHQWFLEQRLGTEEIFPENYRLNVYQQAAASFGPQLQDHFAALTRSAAVATAPRAVPVYANSRLAWRAIGPSPEYRYYDGLPVANTGRVDAIAVHPRDTQTIYLGAHTGGVWKTTNGGSTWTPLTDEMPDLNVNALAVDPQSPETIYWGLGDDFVRVAGLKLLKSINGGLTWSYLPLAFSPYANVTKIQVHPRKSDVVYVAADGIYKTEDSGMSWTRILAASSVHDICTFALHPRFPRILYAGCPHQGFFRSSNGGASWTPLTQLPSTNLGIIYGIDFSPSTPSVIYIFASAFYPGIEHGWYRSTDDGVTWSVRKFPTATACGVLNGEGYAAIAVHPASPDRVYVAGAPLCLTTDGGETWTSLNKLQQPPPMIHADVRALTVDSRTGRVYIGTDGGPWRSDEAGAAFSHLNNSPLQIAQFYTLGLSEARPSQIFGGTQDNGNIYVDRRAGLRGEGFNGADGGFVVVDPDESDIVYAESQNGAGLSQCNLQIPRGASRCQLFRTGIGEYGAWMQPLIMSPFDRETLYTATSYVYQRRPGATSWYPISSKFGSSPVTWLAADPTDPAILYAIQGRSVFRKTSGSDWTNIRPETVGGYRAATSLVVNPRDPRTLYLTISGFISRGSTTTPGHVFKSRDRGATWEDITGNLPDMPVNTLLLHPDDPAQLLVGTDFGVFVTTNGGQAWQKSRGIPNVIVTALGLTKDRYVTAATFGRGLFSAPLVDLHSPPLVSLVINPLQGGDQVQGVVTIRADIDSTLRIRRTQFWLDGKRMATVRKAPYTWTWDTSTAARGPHTIEARAYEVDGDQGKASRKVIVIGP
ncbi:MAG: hypothetical protein HY352_05270 [Candidatus Omnitrophica bacterium]|nr:hypothetical protein [Candidatus Omnitrophota bacterium]